MKMLLCNTGRGGEQCIFSSIVHAYRVAHKAATIHVAICPEFAPLWDKHCDVDGMYLLHHEDKSQPYYMDPIGHWASYSQANADNYDIIEFACEYGLDEKYLHSPRPAIVNIYERLSNKPCALVDVERTVVFYPSNDDLRAADNIIKQYGKDLVLISHVSNTAAPVLSIDGYTALAAELRKTNPVACTGRLNKRGPNKIRTDCYIPGTIDLRGIPLLTLYALASNLKFFVGPDTATPWLVSGMPGRMFVLRGDRRFPLANTGLVVNGFRSVTDTAEVDVVGMSVDRVIDKCLSHFYIR